MKRLSVVLSLGIAFGAFLPALAQSQSRSSSAPRLHLRFDAGWRFLRGDFPGAQNPGYQDSAWRQVDLPHDYSIEDLPPLTQTSLPTLAVVPGPWQFRLGDDPVWKTPRFDDSGWPQVQTPDLWSAHIPGDITSKFGWYRRRFQIPAALRGKDFLLMIGKIDDADETFVNGVKVGGMGTFPPNYVSAYSSDRHYRIPARLIKGDGTDVVAIRVYNGPGEAGLTEAAIPPRRHGPFDAESSGGTAQGYTVGGVGWYRKTFAVPNTQRGRRLSVTFDGVYMNAQFWLNGHLLGTHPYGYTSFSFDLTPYVHFGTSPNVLAVRVDSSGRTSRWYSGAGIYRHVWLTATAPVHIPQWGVTVTTPQATAAQAVVRVRTAVENTQATAQPFTVQSQVVDAAGHVVTAATVSSLAGAHGVHELSQTLTLPRPQLWSPETPSLYSLVSTVTAGGSVVDRTTTPFGIRTISFDAAHGFLLNNHPLKLRGGCVHHDNGPLGAAAYDRAEERRVALLKAAGFNAVRTSHNPPSPAFLEACDRQGLLVIDEAFDCWQNGKNDNDYHLYFQEWWKRDIDSMVQRDRNHPSVILWSIGNEIPEQTTAEGADRAALLAAEVHAQDPTRPVTQATNPDADKLDPLLAHLDVVGYNYASGRFATDESKHPGRLFIQTESFPAAAFDSWMATQDHSFAVGDFVWTALDYLGEAGIGRAIYPGDSGGFTGAGWTVSGCGDIDMDGIRKAQSYYRGILWNFGPPVAAFVDAVAAGDPSYRVSGWGWPDERASWTWPGTNGRTRTVRVYARTPRVKLLLNGRSLGIKETTPATQYTAVYAVPYTPGRLVAVGLDTAGRELSQWVLETAGSPASLSLTPDRHTLTADGEDLCYVSVQVHDAQGRLNPNAANLIQFHLTGPGRIIGVGNGDPQSWESFQQPQRHAFHGQCLVIIRTNSQPGPLHLTAQSPGLQAAQTIITVKASQP